MLHWDKEWLYQKYVVEGLDAQQMANMVNRDITTIYYWMKKFDIPTRPRGHTWKTNLSQGRGFGWTHTQEAKEKISQASIDRGAVPYLRNGKHWLESVPKEDNPNWKGGITPERPTLYRSEEWKEIAKTVWERDNSTCQKCNKRYSEQMRKFDIHHIVPFENEGLRTVLSNLILLCHACHMWVHGSKNVDKEFIGEFNAK